MNEWIYTSAPPVCLHGTRVAKLQRYVFYAHFSESEQSKAGVPFTDLEFDLRHRL